VGEFLAPAPGGIPEIYSLYSSRGGGEGGVFCFGHVICLPAKETDMANSNAVGINETPLYCLCQQGKFGVMLGCDGDDCSIEWFHLQCIGLRRKPTTEKWLCPHCKDKEPSGTHTATCSWICHLYKD